MGCGQAGNGGGADRQLSQLRVLDAGLSWGDANLGGSSLGNEELLPSWARSNDLLLLYRMAKPGLQRPLSRWAVSRPAGMETWGPPQPSTNIGFGSRCQNPHRPLPAR